MSLAFNTAPQPSASILTMPVIEPGKRYRMPSGMGGSFDVRVISITDGIAHVRVDSPRNPDWHGHPIKVAVKALSHIPRLFEVRTRVGKLTGKSDDFLRWATVATRELADEEARQAAHYPQCHPISVVEVEG